MTASRSQANRRVDFSGTTISIHGAILGFVARKPEISLRTIQKHFSATPAEFVAGAVNDLFDQGKLSIHRSGLSRRAGYVYSVRGEDGCTARGV